MRKRPFTESEKKAKSRAKYRDYYLTNKDKDNARCRKNYVKNRERDKANAIERYFLKTHGITRSKAELMLKNSDNKCAICNTSISLGGKDGAHVDHDHESKLFRGFLCNNCNLGLGHFKDNITTLFNAINYLRDFRKKKFIVISPQTEKPAPTRYGVANPFEKTAS